MSQYVKVGGSWLKAKPYVKKDNDWKLSDYVFQRDNGNWDTSFVKGGLVDISWDDKDETGEFEVGPANTVTDLSLQADGKIVVVCSTNNSYWNNQFIGKIVRLNPDTTVDTVFSSNIGTGANSNILAIASQSDGKILVSGIFTSWNGAPVAGFIRLNSNGTRDTSFSTNVGTGASGAYSILVQSDNKILVGGGFTSWNGTAVGRIVRLNSDGTRDTAFSTGAGGDYVRSMALQSDGKILVGGFFTTWSGSTVGRIVCLNSDGTLDTSFVTNTGTGANSYILTIAVQPDGKILVGGNFTSWNGTSVGYIVRLNSDGTRDTTFSTNVGTGAGNIVKSIAIQTDQKVLLGGDFTSWNGTSVGQMLRLDSDGIRDTAFSANIGTGPISSVVSKIVIQSDGKIIAIADYSQEWNSSPINTIIRLNSDGSRTFLNSFANNNVYSIQIQSDEKILVGGGFNKWNGSITGGIVRLNTDASIDTAFSTNIGTGNDGNTSKLAIQPDGKILVSGYFSSWNGSTVGDIVRLNSDGTRDTTFSTNVGTGGGGNISQLGIQSDGKILVGGYFSSWNGSTVGDVVRLNYDGTRDTTFSTNVGTGGGGNIELLTIQPDGKILVGGYFSSWNGASVGYIVRLNSDGTRDTTFSTNVGSAANSYTYTSFIQPDGKILVGGEFTSWNGVTVGRIVRLNSNGTLDTSFMTNTGTGASAYILVFDVQSDGRILVGGRFNSWNTISTHTLARLNADGSVDTSFSANVGLGANVQVYPGSGGYPQVTSIAIQSNSKMLIGGAFKSFTVNNKFRRYFARIGIEDAS